MPQAAVVIHVQMREHDPLDVTRPDAERAQLRPDLLLRRDPEADLPADIRMERARVIQKVLALPGIDDDQAVAVIDQPGIGRQPIGPLPIGKTPRMPRGPRPAPRRSFCPRLIRTEPVWIAWTLVTGVRLYLANAD